jgi:hypothetical protein
MVRDSHYSQKRAQSGRDFNYVSWLYSTFLTHNTLTLETSKLTANEALAKSKDGYLTFGIYARSLESGIALRDEVIKAWAHLDTQYFLE